MPQQTLTPQQIIERAPSVNVETSELIGWMQELNAAVNSGDRLPIARVALSIEGVIVRALEA